MSEDNINQSQNDQCDDDAAREQETQFVLQNQTLMQQIADSMKTHKRRKGYTPTKGELDEILASAH